jgi:FkbM family methyltransferase
MDRSELVASILRNIPLYSGAGTLANHSLTRFLAGSVDPAAWATVPGGKVFADLSDHVGRAAYFSGDLDRKVTWICSRIVRPGDTVLDIGANIGIVTLWLSELVGDTGSVHSFEPNPDVATVLLAGLEHKKVRNTSVHQYALGTERSTLELMVPRHNRGSASLVRHKGREACDAYTVTTDTLSHVVAESGIGSIRFMKIDVEGFEEEVFRGGEEMFRTTPPDAILFESAGEKDTSADDRVIGMLRQHGYEIYVVPRCLTSMHVRRLRTSDRQDHFYSDLLAIRMGPAFSEIHASVHAID